MTNQTNWKPIVSACLVLTIVCCSGLCAIGALIWQRFKPPVPLNAGNDTPRIVKSLDGNWKRVSLGDCGLTLELDHQIWPAHVTLTQSRNPGLASYARFSTATRPFAVFIFDRRYRPGGLNIGKIQSGLVNDVHFDPHVSQFSYKTNSRTINSRPATEIDMNYLLRGVPMKSQAYLIVQGDDVLEFRGTYPADSQSSEQGWRRTLRSVEWNPAP